MPKLNLFLRVLAREADGFHGIETLFCLVSLADTLRAERREAAGVTLDVDGPDLGPPDRNLAVAPPTSSSRPPGDVSAYISRWRSASPCAPGSVAVRATPPRRSIAVNHLANGAVPDELLQFAARLGSDVPFFTAGGPLALGWGHGERLCTCRRCRRRRPCS